MNSTPQFVDRPILQRHGSRLHSLSVTKRRYVFLTLLIVVMTVGAQFIGEWFRATIIGVLAVSGIVLTIWHERWKRRIVEFLATREPEDQDALLVWDEGWQDRPEILERLGRRGPRVPLRGEREIFGYAPHHATMARFSTAMGILIVIAALGNAVLALPPEPSERVALLALVVGFGAMTLLMPWQIRLATSQLEITDNAITVIGADGRREVTAWSDIAAAKDSRLASALILRTMAGRRIWIGHVIEGYGRLANLIATRLPEHLAWRSV